MKVPMLDPTRFWNHSTLRSSLLQRVEKVLSSGQYIMGPEVKQFEEACSQYLGVTHSIGVTSGTDALLLALMAYNIGPGDEVICPSFTFFATAGSIARLGATPVFVDILPDCFTLDPDLVKKAITKRTKAIIPVHLFGQCADMDALLPFMKEDGIPLIEDACQAIGASLNGQMAGALGSIGTFSFFPSKNLGGFGDAGMVTTSSPFINSKVRSLRVHGSEVQYIHNELGGNFRMDTMQAALLLEKLPYLKEALTRRRQYAARYLSEINDNRAFTLPQEVRGNHSWNQFTLRVRSGLRDKLKEYLGRVGISSAIYYPVPLHKQPAFSKLAACSLPETERASQEVLSIPITTELEESEISYVIGCLNNFSWLLS